MNTGGKWAQGLPGLLQESLIPIMYPDSTQVRYFGDMPYEIGDIVTQEQLLTSLSPVEQIDGEHMHHFNNLAFHKRGRQIRNASLADRTATNLGD